MTRDNKGTSLIALHFDAFSFVLYHYSHQQSLDTLHSWVTTHCDRLKQLDQFNEVLQCCHNKVMTVNNRASTPELNQ